MILLIAGQDIKELTLGILKQGSLFFEQRTMIRPEGYLATIDKMLTDWNVSPDDLEGVAVVTGPGSFTSSRISVTIANAIAFAKHLPLRTLENPKRLLLAQLVESVDWSLPQKGGTFAVPTYDRPPQITLPRLD